MITPISPEGAHATRCSAVTDAVIQRAVTRRAAALKGNSRADARDAVATPSASLSPRGPRYFVSRALSLPRRSRVSPKPVMRLDLYELPRSRSPDSDIFRWRCSSSLPPRGEGLIGAAPLSSSLPPRPSSVLSRLFSLLPFASPLLAARDDEVVVAPGNISQLRGFMGRHKDTRCVSVA